MKLNLLFIPTLVTNTFSLSTDWYPCSLIPYKIIEKLLFKRLDNVIENKRLQRSQHGFRSGRYNNLKNNHSHRQAYKDY